MLAITTLKSSSHGSPDGSKTVQYNGIIAILLEAIKAQQVQIDEIKAKLNENI